MLKISIIEVDVYCDFILTSQVTGKKYIRSSNVSKKNRNKSYILYISILGRKMLDLMIQITSPPPPLDPR